MGISGSYQVELAFSVDRDLLATTQEDPDTDGFAPYGYHVHIVDDRTLRDHALGAKLGEESGNPLEFRRWGNQVSVNGLGDSGSGFGHLGLSVLFHVEPPSQGAGA